MNNTKGILGQFLYNLAHRNYRTLRLASMATDHMILSGVIMIPSLIIIFINSRYHHDFDRFLWPIILFIYMNKDVFQGKSIGKRLWGYKVVKLGTTQTASSFQCYLRNIIVPFLWPIEVIVTYVNPKRRLGDFISKTEVVKDKKELVGSILTDLKNFTVSFQLLYIIISAVIFNYFFGYIT